MRKFLILISIALFMNSCYYGFYNRKPKTTTKKIGLERNYNPERLFTYENKSSVTYLDIQDIIKLLNKKLDDKKLCEQKRLKYNSLVDRLNATENNGFYVYAAMNPELLKKLLPEYDTTITGYVPMDFYSRGLGVDLTAENWIPPYGFEPIFVDTLNADRYERFYDWIITSLILKGKAQVLRKSDNEYQDYVIYEIVDFRDGHGGESLLYKDKKIFMNVDVYTDMILPDFECMDSTEIKQWRF